jgi:type VI secretion system protein ImpA
MDDDTPAANAETQQWLSTEIFPPPPPEPVVAAPEPEPEPVKKPAYPASSDSQSEPPPPDIFETAMEVLKRGRAGEAISMLVRDSEQQPSGRMRFQRRVQMAQLCLTANQAAVAYPVLRDLSGEIERRTLETWESAEMLSTPLSLYLQCLDQRNASEQEREAIFERLCRLDPQAALTARS